MTAQGELDFAPQPRTHTGDPQTSHDAEARSRKTWGPKHDDLMAALAERPGQKNSELADACCVADVRRRDAGAEPIWPSNYVRREAEVRRRMSDLHTCKPKRVRAHSTPGERESRWFVAED